ncbi:GNAT family N-acetyltransferase [Streptomyces sp. MUM 203J]|uniref:GNAT family N-acetyltransferase n=1 Tax=Streptomyces sp. MUM 203J TaxID=2791990 RepID=UPI001F042C03|nr:GNAT family N-acyltransferase [Streptomyces sp. MUM 203J]MCH0541572.1 GNAT family N-acetyltransferase [Streptomyces sp. MUM 203J]
MPAPSTATPTLTPPAPESGPAPSRYRLSLAREQEDVRAAQRLRHLVFAAEFGARVDGPEPGLEGDAFDAYCDHVLVHDEATGEVVGTYRLLPPERAAIAGRLYSEGEFDLTRLHPLRDRLVEVGRSCVHPAHRNGAVISLIWAGIARYMTRTGHTWLAGCCSLPLGDGGALAAGTWDTVKDKHLAPEEYWVTPHRLWTPEDDTRPGARTPLPPLLRGYLRLGAWVCGAPAHDPDFRVADLFVLLSMNRIHPRYLRHFLSLA